MKRRRSPITERVRAYLRTQSPRTKHALRSLYYLPSDVAAGARRGGADLVPPQRLQFVGDGDFRQIGQEFARYFIELGGLKPSEDVLDVGCGVGRMALPLTSYLNGQGSYQGFDVVPYGVRWCQRNVTPRFPNFRFQVADIRNSMYNPDGEIAAAQYRFPFPDAEFDFAYATSVFTHMLPDEVGNYVGELARVLRPGGRCFATFFLLNEESRRLVAEGTSRYDFRHGGGVYRTIDPRTSEAAVAYDEEFVTGLLREHGLGLERQLYGDWAGRREFLSHQDVLIARRS
jgi:SAM-dependent methyltransferase